MRLFGWIGRKEIETKAAPQAQSHICVCTWCGRRFPDDERYIAHECKAQGNIKPSNPNFGRR
jgi:hypothetical protein